MNLEAQAQKMKLDAATAIHKQRIFSATEGAKLNQTLVQSEVTHRQSLQQQKEKASLQNKTSKSGKPAK